MLAQVFSACLAGVDAALVRVEVHVSQGLPAFATVGLPDPSVRESRERVRTAVLKGAKPSDLAVEQPTRFELVLNLRSAKALGLKISPALRLRADHIIE